MSIHETYNLTEEQMEKYKQNGFLVIENLFTSAECDELNRTAVDMVMGRIPVEEGNGIDMEPAAVAAGLASAANPDPAYLFKIGHRIHVSNPVFRQYAMSNKITDILASLIGPDLLCVQSMYIDKPKNIGIGQPYHQDSHYIRMEPDTLMGVWIALDDVDEQNGCLHVISGSHREPVYPHETAIDERQRQLYIEVHSARDRPEVACPLPKGGAVLFPGKMLHRSGNNVTADRQRRAYVLHYASARSIMGHKPEHEQFMLVRGGK
jgi:phytanoyl-CoA hydroxylase